MMKNIKFRNKNQILRVLLVFFTLVISQGLFSSAIASLISTPNLVIKSAIYEVNKTNGDLFININGNVVDLSLCECEIGLNIPESCIVAERPNGSPVLELLNEGIPTKVERELNEFQLGFRLETYDSTPLPTNYTLTIYYKDKQIKETIHPEWDSNLAGGIGAARPVPEITEFYAYDSDKGDTEHVRTYIYYDSLPIASADVERLKYEITSYDYEDWEDQCTPYYGEKGLFYGGQTYVVHDYLSCTFNAQSTNKRYALNAGDYSITNVFAEGMCNPGGEWFDDYAPSSSEGDFKINRVTNENIIMVGVIYDSEFSQFLSTHSKSWNTFINDVQSNPIDQHHRSTQDYDSYSDGMEDIQDLMFKFYKVESEWWDDGGDSEAVPTVQEVRDAGQTFIGSSYDWNYHDGGHAHWGTDAYNHGFDVLFAFTGEGASNCGGALRDENWCRISLNSGSSYKYGVLVTLHEFYHLYNILDGGGGQGQSDTPDGYVMNGGENYSGGPSGHSYSNGWFRIDYDNNYLIWNTYESKYFGFS